MGANLFGGNTPGLPQAVVLGIQGSQASVLSLDFYGEYDESEISNPINLPYETYPVASATDPLGGVYVGLHATKGALVPPITEGKTELENVIDYVNKMTRPLDSVVESPQLIKLNVTSGKVVWEGTLTTVEGRSTIGGMQYIANRDVLVVVGSSNGEGSYVGAGVASNGDWDGYVTLVDASTGEVDDSAANLTHLAADHSLRIQSQPNQDDFILGVCTLEDKLFILGSTTGVIDGTESGGAFIMKVDIDTLNVIWKTQIVGDGVEATQCIGFQNVLYVGGHVPAGVTVDDPTRTYTSDTDDVFVSYVDAGTGGIVWLRQIDSRRDDRLTGLLINQVGNAMIVGSAMDLDASVSTTFINSVLLQSGYHDWQLLPSDSDPFRFSFGDEDAIEESSGNDDDNKTTVIVVAVVVPVVLLLLVAFYAIMSSKSNNNTSGLPEDEAAQAAPEGNPLGEDQKVSQSALENDNRVV
jgi:hypothetical protein